MQRKNYVQDGPSSSIPIHRLQWLETILLRLKTNTERNAIDNSFQLKVTLIIYWACYVSGKCIKI